MKKILIFFVFLIIIISCKKEVATKSDPLSPDRKQTERDYRRVFYLSTVFPDSLQFYAEKLEKETARQPNEYKAMAVIVKSIYYANFNSYQLAMEGYEKGLLLLKDSKADSLKCRLYIGIGSCAKVNGNNPKAFANLYKALAIYEKLGDRRGIADVNANLAHVYMQKGDSQLAKQYLQIALKTLEKDKTDGFYLTTSHSLANVYGMNGEYDKALALDEEGIRISEKIGSDKIKVMFLDNKANCFMYTNRLDSAQYYFDECLKLDYKIGNKKQIADSYGNLGFLASLKKDFPTAEKLLFKSIEILKEIKHKPNLAKSYSLLVGVYEQQEKFKQALETQKEFYKQYKLMIDERKEASLAEFRIIHETQQKEKKLAQNKVELLKREVESKRKNTTILILSVLVFFVIIVGYMIYRQQRLKVNQQQQEFQLKSAISQIETQNKLQEQRLSISRDLHDNIGAQLTFIISSVDNVKYGFGVKNTVLGSKLDNISNFTRETIIELRDTIWAMNNNHITFEDLRVRILNFIEKAKLAKEDIHFKFSIEDSLEDVSFSSVQGINIYRTIQEALNNAIKHANASEIIILARLTDGAIRVEIDDNGKGFEFEATEIGNGLHNMKKRMEDIGGVFEIGSEMGKGTRISIVIDKPFLNN
ncbi:tetratricopeptide repeat protein [Flavobacterium sp. PLA-1-15]|uniref:tetratricopeptide repeat protein n=1 Tax=Flavobacterium sp. PLA-1-15 TaxID=3380533 RepID=UPI003B7A3836